MVAVRIRHWCYNNDNKLRVSKRKSEIQDGGFENSVAQNNLSLSLHMIATKFQRLRLCFRGQAVRTDNWEYCLGLLEIKNGGLNRNSIGNYVYPRSYT